MIRTQGRILLRNDSLCVWVKTSQLQSPLPSSRYAPSIWQRRRKKSNTCHLSDGPRAANTCHLSVRPQFKGTACRSERDTAARRQTAGCRQQVSKPSPDSPGKPTSRRRRGTPAGTRCDRPRALRARGAPPARPPAPSPLRQWLSPWPSRGTSSLLPLP